MLILMIDSSIIHSYRDSLHSHEKELERTSHNIKELIKEVKNLINTAKNLSKAQRSLASHLISFRFDCIGSNQTDDELVIAGSLKEFGRLINTIEDERDRMLERAYDNFIVPLETFRKEQVGQVSSDWSVSIILTSDWSVRSRSARRSSTSRRPSSAPARRGTWACPPRSRKQCCRR